MARFRLRSWQEQTLYDCRDYEVEAGTVEEAAELLGELQFEAQEISGPVDLPPNVWCIDGTGREMRVLDPREIVDSESGIAEIDEDRNKLRDVPPVVTNAPGDEQGVGKGRLFELAPQLRDTLAELLEWEARMGGWESPCWDAARSLMASLRQLPASF